MASSHTNGGEEHLQEHPENSLTDAEGASSSPPPPPPGPPHHLAGAGHSQPAQPVADDAAEDAEATDSSDEEEERRRQFVKAAIEMIWDDDFLQRLLGDHMRRADLLVSSFFLEEEAEEEMQQHLFQASLGATEAGAAEADTEPRQRKKRRRDQKRDPFASPWMRYAVQGKWSNPRHRQGRLFRRRFRMPHLTFLDLVRMHREQGDFPEKPDAFGKIIPLELKILGVLHALGRGTVFDELEDVTGVSEETHRVFFHRFTKLYSRKYYPFWVTMPSTPEEIASTMSEYKTAGLKGCIGSMDVVHIWHDRIPAARSNIYTGKEGYPTVAFEVIVDHKRRINSCTIGMPGSYNDKTIVTFDSVAQSIRFGELYGHVEYDLRTAPDGHEERVKGAWLLVDGGYQSWRNLQCPIRDATSDEATRWSKMMTSMRKDVETTFGILKMRWRILKIGIRLMHVEDVDHVMKTCCCLHNMLLKIDGLDEDWTDVGARRFEVLYPGAFDRDEVVALLGGNVMATASEGLWSKLTNMDLSIVGMTAAVAGGETVQALPPPVPATSSGLADLGIAGHHALRARLIKHFAFEDKDGKVRWPVRRPQERAI